MKVLFVYPDYPDTFWSFKHALKFVSKKAAFPPVEGYKLSVTLKGVTIQAAGEAGVFYGLQTLRQLLSAEIYQKKQVEGVAWTIPCVEITDSPRFEWRGMMLDVARHYQPVDFIHKYIDLMAIHKLNRFHLHLTDHNAWRVHRRSIPVLYQNSCL